MVRVKSIRSTGNSRQLRNAKKDGATTSTETVVSTSVERVSDPVIPQPWTPDAELVKLVDQLNIRWEKYSGGRSNFPPHAADAIRTEFRHLFHVKNIADSLYVNLKKDLSKVKLHIAFREQSLSNLQGVASRLSDATEKARIEAERFVFDDSVQANAFDILQLRYDELSMDHLEDHDMDEGILAMMGGVSANDPSTSVCAELLGDKLFNHMAFEDAGRILKKKLANEQLMMQMKLEEDALDREIARLEQSNKTRVKNLKELGPLVDSIPTWEREMAGLSAVQQNAATTSSKVPLS